MYAYHIDRSHSNHFNKGDNIVLSKSITNFEETNLLLETQFSEGLTKHGQKYLTNSIDPRTPWNNFYETIFEYERKINFPEKISRYQSLFALEKLDDVRYWEEVFQLKGKEPIWKVYAPDDKVFRADASWFTLENFDQSTLRISYNARQYWSGNLREGYSAKPELLIRGSMRLVERVR
ncbi:DUF2441 domain-containing protein [Virgibacillus kekensis]|uniref:DUF2441 domain-containing protein n=1 Tax=Virgibacillus kekensis TaxID=202261 RepID=A0ABV9DKM5_9BACI